MAAPSNLGLHWHGARLVSPRARSKTGWEKAVFSTVDTLYGGLGAVTVLLVWLFLAGWVILFGGELNDVMARELAR